MHTSLDARALSLVEACLDIEDEAARADYLARECADAPELRARVDRILEMDQTRYDMLATKALVAAAPVPDVLPERIGPFRITRALGRGGMGVVLEAERDDGVYNQTVAIKLIRGDLAEASARERFTQERRILARLDHPAIARILDGGDQDGRPYLVMDYVDGAPVTEALAARNAGIDATLDGFAAICAAVAHAHRNLVVHADIKPSNVIMTADGAIKLLDFGIARLTVDLDTDVDATPYPLTRGYAAPERLAGAPPAIPGDVYSLGVLLHEMLAGVAPRDGQAMSSLAEGGRIPPQRLAGDLDAIVARALAADPRDRYPDVASLAGDIAAARANQPVAARAGEGWRYFAAKFFRRHRTAVMLTGAAILGLIAATLVTATLYVRAERARGAAEARFIDLRQLARFMLFDLYDDLSNAPGTVNSRVRIAETSGRYLDHLRRSLDPPVDVRLDSAAGYRRLANVQGISGTAGLGRPSEAKTSLDAAEQLLRPVLAENPRNVDALEQLGWIYADRWTLQADNAESPRINNIARGYFDRALAIEPARVTARLGRLITDKNEAFERLWQDQPQRSGAIAARALAELRSLAVPPGSRKDALILEVTLLNRLGDATYYGGRIPAALPFYEQADAIIVRQLARQETLAWLNQRGNSLYNISGTLADIPGRAGEGLAKAEQGIAVMERVLSFGVDAEAEKRLLVLLGQQSLLLAQLGRPAAAVVPSSRSIAIRDERARLEPNDPARERDIAVALPAHARILAAAGRNADACAAARRAVEVWASIAAKGRLGAKDARDDQPRSVKMMQQFCGGSGRGQLARQP